MTEAEAAAGADMNALRKRIEKLDAVPPLLAISTW
jgi:hypothetical protein